MGRVTKVFFHFKSFQVTETYCVKWKWRPGEEVTRQQCLFCSTWQTINDVLHHYIIMQHHSNYLHDHPSSMTSTAGGWSLSLLTLGEVGGLQHWQVASSSQGWEMDSQTHSHPHRNQTFLLQDDQSCYLMDDVILPILYCLICQQIKNTTKATKKWNMPRENEGGH